MCLLVLHCCTIIMLRDHFHIGLLQHLLKTTLSERFFNLHFARKTFKEEMMLGLLLSLVFAGQISAFSTPNSDFLLGIDGSSVATGYSHVCALEQRPGSNVGGRAQCWGSEHKEHAMDAPRDVRYL